MCDKQINQAVLILNQGGVIAYPTESVFGLGCDPKNEQAVKNILKLKKRNKDKGLILIASEFAQLRPWLDSLDEALETQVKQTWPGATTWLWPAKESISSLLTGQHKTLAVRITDHPVAKSLCQMFGGAIVSTSANVSGEPAARSSTDASKLFKDQVDLILDGKTGGKSRPTEIRDVMTGKLIRPSY